MNKDFDQLSLDYSEILTHDVRVSGEDAAYFASYKADRIRGVLGARFEGRILDYGCGIGLVLKFLRTTFNQDKVSLFGYDVSRESIKRCEASLPDGAFAYDLASLPERHFEAIILANVLHHISPENRDEQIRHIGKLLRPDGRLFVFEHNPLNPVTRWIVKRSPIDKNVSLLYSWEALRLLKHNGFSGCGVTHIVFFPKFLSRLRFLDPYLGSFPLGAQYMCIGQMTRQNDGFIIQN